MTILFIFIVLIQEINWIESGGPDPWNQKDSDKANVLDDNIKIPPDLRIIPEQKSSSKNNLSTGEWFSKRLLTIMLKGGQIQENEDESVNVHMDMKFNKEQWLVLNKYIQSNSVFTEDMFRRSLGYIQEAIYKPSFVENIAITWSEYFQKYVVEYKMYITWILSASAVFGILSLMWNRMNRKNLICMVFILFYLYEVFISYKEAEQQEFERFVNAVNSCSWHFWTSTCNIPPPDPLVFIKHMNPLKIGLRMFATIVSEPMISINEVMKIMLQGITNELWYPFNKIVYGILIIIFNFSLLYFAIMIIFNYVFNISTYFSYLGGLFTVGINQRKRELNVDHDSNQTRNVDTIDRINNVTINKILDVCTRALNTAQSNSGHISRPHITTSEANGGLRRTASTGRLPDDFGLSFGNVTNTNTAVGNKTRRRKFGLEIGSGDAR